MSNQSYLRQRQTLVWHLQSNFFPPFPPDYQDELVELAQDAIAHANEGGWDDEIKLPDGVVSNGKVTMTVSEIVEWLRLEDMVEQGEEEDDD
ncbi:MAG TPA: hypothetical protein VH593_11355 [Ktedonobacteraceae bacterium]|jgi:hypothetical protein